MWIEYNPNPAARSVGDCSVRATAKALRMNWETAYATLVKAGFSMCDMPSSDGVWGAVLRQNGFNKKIVPDTCPDCYSLTEFCNDHPKGLFVVGTGGHVVAVEDGDYYDSWDSGREVPIYYWMKPEEENNGNVQS